MVKNTHNSDHSGKLDFNPEFLILVWAIFISTADRGLDPVEAFDEEGTIGVEKHIR